MARRVAASYVEVLQTEGAAARVTQESAEALTGDGAQKARVTQANAEALLVNNTAAKARTTQLSAEILRTVGDNIAQARVTGLSLEVLTSVASGTGRRPPVVCIIT